MEVAQLAEQQLQRAKAGDARRKAARAAAAGPRRAGRLVARGAADGLQRLPRGDIVCDRQADEHAPLEGNLTAQAPCGPSTARPRSRYLHTRRCLSAPWER